MTMSHARHIPATISHAAELAQTMRPADRCEVWASDRQLPFTAASTSIRSSELAMTTLINGQVAAIWGVLKSPVSGAFIVWLLSSTVVDRCPVAFWRACKTEMARLLYHYPVLCNFVDARHIQSVRWLRRLGFLIFDAEPYGIHGEPFHFVMRRAHTYCAHEDTREGRAPLEIAAREVR